MCILTRIICSLSDFIGMSNGQGPKGARRRGGSKDPQLAFSFTCRYLAAYLDHALLVCMHMHKCIGPK